MAFEESNRIILSNAYHSRWTSFIVFMHWLATVKLFHWHSDNAPVQWGLATQNNHAITNVFWQITVYFYIQPQNFSTSKDFQYTVLPLLNNIARH